MLQKKVVESQRGEGRINNRRGNNKEQKYGRKEEKEELRNRSKLTVARHEWESHSDIFSP